MPKNRMTFSDPRGELPAVTIEALKNDLLRLTQVDRDGRTNVVMLSARHGVVRDVILDHDRSRPSTGATA